MFKSEKDGYRLQYTGGRSEQGITTMQRIDTDYTRYEAQVNKECMKVTRMDTDYSKHNAEVN